VFIQQWLGTEEQAVNIGDTIYCKKTCGDTSPAAELTGRELIYHEYVHVQQANKDGFLYYGQYALGR
jgi:hypothetical protein